MQAEATAKADADRVRLGGGVWYATSVAFGFAWRPG